MWRISSFVSTFLRKIVFWLSVICETSAKQWAVYLLKTMEMLVKSAQHQRLLLESLRTHMSNSGLGAKQWCKAGTYPRTMRSLVSSCDTQGLQSQSMRYLAQSLCRKRSVAPMRSRIFIRLGPYWTAADSSLVKKSLWKTGGALMKYLAANLKMKRGKKVGWSVISHTQIAGTWWS